MIVNANLLTDNRHLLILELLCELGQLHKVELRGERLHSVQVFMSGVMCHSLFTLGHQVFQSKLLRGVNGFFLLVRSGVNKVMGKEQLIAM